MTKFELHEKHADLAYALKKLADHHPEDGLVVSRILKEVDEIVESLEVMLDESSEDPENK